MVRIAPIRLAYNPKTLWFDPGDLELRRSDPVVVSTARGLEFGRMAEDVFEADEAQVKKLKTALKPVKRLASEEDVARAEEMCRRSEEALPVFKQMAAEASEDMHPVSVEFLLDGDKAVFYFEAEERVDFRELVRKLASHFHVRIDMRQIGVRDEARMVGGLGHCGQELCCKRLGGEFCPVSIRMAKEQDLSLNPQKISGVCGRLMCCLRYEFDAYKDFKSRAPKQNSQVETPAGTAKVVDLDVPREIVSLKVEGEKPVTRAARGLRAARRGLEPPEPRGAGRLGRGHDAGRDRRGGRELHLRHLAADRFRQAGRSEGRAPHGIGRQGRPEGPWRRREGIRHGIGRQLGRLRQRVAQAAAAPFHEGGGRRHGPACDDRGNALQAQAEARRRGGLRRGQEAGIRRRAATAPRAAATEARRAPAPRTARGAPAALRQAAAAAARTRTPRSR